MGVIGVTNRKPVELKAFFILFSFWEENKTAEKRMFSKSVVLCDTFLDMPATARCLYFTLNMLADDDGFVDSPKSVMRQSGASEDDMKILLAKFFLIPFDTGIVVIRHWRINNYLRSDRYRETRYLNEKAEPKLLDKTPRNELEKIEKLYLENYQSLYESGLLKMASPVINWNVCRKLEKDCIAKYGFDVIAEAVRKSVNNKFAVSKGYVLTTILSAGVLAQLINSSDGRIDNDQIAISEVDF